MTGRPAGVSQKAWTFLKAEGMTQGLAADVLCTLMWRRVEKSGEGRRRMEKNGDASLYYIQCTVYSVATHLCTLVHSEMNNFTVYAVT